MWLESGCMKHWLGGLFIWIGVTGTVESLPCRMWQVRPMNLVQKEGEELCLEYARPCYKGPEEVSVAKESCKSFAQIT